MTNDIEIIDAHHHFWDLNKNYYPFLRDKIDPNFFLGNYETIRENYLPIDYINDSRNHNVVGTIHCEAEWDRNDQVGETRWLKDLSLNNKFPNAIVAHAWFHKKNSEEIIAEQASFDMVKGIRSKPITKFSQNSQEYLYEGSMQDINWRNGLKLLEKYNLNYDLRIPNWHLEEAVEIVRLIPNTKVIINHAGFPWNRTDEGMDYWRKGIKLMSLEPNTFIKLSEFGVKGEDWNYYQNKKIIHELIDLFGPQRCMFASNFPVSKIKISFDDLYKNYKKIVKDFSDDEKKWLFAKTASEVYNL
ncbi:MAG: amidohydrolase family protein [Candidatus Puniceispirillales bacterium]|jgi:predicted TIM-barrel fold metal-dependent hydrolase